MHYVDTGGEGEAVLLLHGNPTWSFLWRDLARSLAIQGFRCIAPDHIGMGLSEKGNRFFRLADRIGHIERLVDSLRISRFHLCVHDWGGAIGFGVAGRAPERVGKIVAMNTAAFRAPEGAHLPWRIALCRMPQVGEFIVRALNGFARAAVFMAARRRLSSVVRAGFLAPYDSWRSRGAIARFVRDIPLEPNHPSLPTLIEVENNLNLLHEKRVMLAWGGQDFCFNDAYFARWRELFPDALVRYYHNAGHYVLEDAGELLIPEIRAFLAEE
jgi:haloalkane dehalogenase